jgi:hypothetical protein
MLEGTNWLVTKAFRGSSLLGDQFRAGTAHAIAKGCTDILGSVSPKHAGLYESIGYRVIGSERSYSDEFYDPVVLVRLDLQSLDTSCAGQEHDFLMSYWVTENHYSPLVREWIPKAEAAFRDPYLLRELCVERGQLLQRCSPEDLQKIRDAWGDSLFDEVTASGLTASTGENRPAVPLGQWRFDESPRDLAPSSVEAAEKRRAG